MPGFGITDFDSKPNINLGVNAMSKKKKSTRVAQKENSVGRRLSGDAVGPKAQSSRAGTDSDESTEIVPYVYKGVGADSDRVTFAILAKSLFEFSASKDPSVEKGRVVKNDQMVEVLVVTGAFIVGCTVESGQTVLITNEVGHSLNHRHFTVSPDNFEAVIHVGDILKVPMVRCLNRRVAFADMIDSAEEVKPEEAIGYGIVSDVATVNDRTKVRIRLEVNDNERKRQHFETRAFGWLREEALHRSVMVRYLPGQGRFTHEHGIFGVSLLLPVEDGVTCRVPSPDKAPWRRIAYAEEDDATTIEIPKSVLKKFGPPFKLFSTHRFVEIFQGFVLMLDTCPNQPRDKLGDALRPARRAYKMVDYIPANSEGPPVGFKDRFDSSDEGEGEADNDQEDSEG